jgi:broad specificity phosphatase PhoE
MQTRRAQQPITIRSDRAAARLKLLTRDGRSQAQVIEEALEALPVPDVAVERSDRLARLNAIVAELRKRTDIPSMAEFDAREYDERGNPR